MRSRRVVDYSLLGALAIGLAVRLGPTLSADFPRLDGGLFYVMIRDLQANSYRLPEFTSYNGTGIPFAYPPLVLYAVGLLSDLTGWSVLDVLRIQPAVLSSLALLAFVPLARRLTGSDAEAAFATLVVAVLPGTYEWQIAGGGITRSAGALFAILLLHRLLVMLEEHRRRDVALAALLGGALLLTHLEWSLFAAYSAGLLLLFRGHSNWGAVAGAAVGAGAVVVALPWLVVVLDYHGVGPFWSAVTGSGGVFPPGAGLVALAVLDWTGEFIPWFVIMGAAGAVLRLSRRDYLLPVWLGVVFVMQSRGLHQFIALPLAMLAGTAIANLDFMLWRLTGPRETSARAPAIARASALILTAIGACMALLSTSVSPAMKVLPAGESNAMVWAGANTEPAARFLVLAGSDWSVSSQQEWFPAIAGRRSLTTVQAHEWLPGEFERRFRANRDALKCAARGPRCLEEWRARWGDVDYVYLQRQRGNPGLDMHGCCERLYRQLLAEPGYTRVFENAEAAIVRAPARGAVVQLSTRAATFGPARAISEPRSR